MSHRRMRIMSCLLLVSLCVLLRWHASMRSLQQAARSTVPTVDQVKALSSLVCTRVAVSDVQVTEIHGYTGGVRAALLVRGDFLLGCDLTQAKFSSVETDERQAVLFLPEPRATSPRVDHQRTKLVGLFLPRPLVDHAR